jgi:group I intron endonuclease
MLIYILTNQINGKYYVGKTKQDNLHQYLSLKRYQVRKGLRTQPLLMAMRKYGFENFSAEILGTTETHEELCELEKLWILLLECRNPKIGYNVMAGGEHVYRKPIAEETRQKLRLSALAAGRKPIPYVHTAKHCQQISARVKGTHYGKGIPHKKYNISEAGREIRRQAALKQWQDPSKRPDKNRRVATF